MDDGGLDFVEVAQGADDLHDDGACLLLGHQLVLLQIEVQVVAFTELQDSAEPTEVKRRSHTGGKVSAQRLKVIRTEVTASRSIRV